MATSYEFKAKLRYTDLETKTYTLPVASAEQIDPATMMTRAKELNRVFGGASSSIDAANTYAAAMQQTFVSSEGAPVSGIISMSTITREEEVIYSD